MSLSNKKRSMVTLEDTSDDLLTIILVRLPARSIFRFRCVSKRWNNIVSSPFFIRSYNYRVRTRESYPMVLGLIQNTLDHLYERASKNVSVIVPVPPVNEHKIVTSAKLINCEFLNSSNGFILCLHNKYQKQYTFSIFNPLTNRSISLPMSPSLYSSSSVSLICEENPQALNVKYKVFAIEEIKSKYVSMLTFSSDTGEWKTSTLTSTSPLSCGLNKLNWKFPVTANAFIFYSFKEFFAVYDTNNETCILQLIEQPCRYYPFIGTIDTIRSPGDDSLWLCLKRHEYLQLKIWMLPKGEYGSYKRSSTTIPRSKWVLMHNFDYAPLFKTISISQNVEEKKNTQYIIGKWIILKVPHVVLLPCCGRYYICNLENNSFEEVEYNLLGIDGVQQFSPYLEPLCLSSYAL